MTASLAGLESAGGDALATELAVRRILLLYAIAFAHGGLPLLYMGDELGLRNDAEWADDPARRDDNRWMHRPPMDWEAAERRHDRASVEGRLWDGLQRLLAARRATRAVHAQGRCEPFWTGNDHVFGLLREHAGERLLVLANFTADRQAVPLAVARDRGFALDRHAAVPDGRSLTTHGEVLLLEPYQHAWLRDRDGRCAS
jgi:amylosucrase